MLQATAREGDDPSSHLLLRFLSRGSGRALASWSHAGSLTQTHRGQSIFGWICCFLKILHSSISMPKPSLFTTQAVSCFSTVRGLAVVDWKPWGQGASVEEYCNSKTLRAQQKILIVAIEPTTLELSNTDFWGENKTIFPLFCILIQFWNAHNNFYSLKMIKLTAGITNKTIVFTQVINLSH